MKPPQSPTPTTPTGATGRLPGLTRGALALASTLAGAIATAIPLLPTTARAEDTGTFRTYLHLRAGELGAQWGTDDHWGLSAGANLSQHWGLELAGDAFEETLEPDALGTLGEISSTSLIPQVRFRLPLLGQRLAPYAVAGAGVSFLQFNDRTLDGRGRDIDLGNDDVRFALTGGVGIEYFLADNLAFGFEGKYLWMDPLTLTVDSRAVDWDMSAAMFTFGFRVYLCENSPLPLVTAAEASSDLIRLHFGMRFGGSVLTDSQWSPGIELEPEAQALAGTLNQFAGLSLGADFGRNWGIELVLGGGEWVPVVAGIGGIGEYASVGCLPMIRYRHPLGPGRWVPYVTAGGGFLYHEFNDQRFPGNEVKVRETQGFSPAIAAGGGFEYFLARNVSFGAEVRWQTTWDHRIQINDGPTVVGDFSDLQIMLALRLYLLEFGDGRR